MTNSEMPKQDHILSNKMYDLLKFLAQILLPALGTLYFTLSGIWGLPSAEQVVGTIVAIDTFLGVILQISTKSYNNSDSKYFGDIDVLYMPEGKKTYSLNINRGIEPSDIEKETEVTFKVNAPDF